MVSMQAHTSYFPLVNLRTNSKSINNQCSKKEKITYLIFHQLIFYVVSTIWREQTVNLSSPIINPKPVPG